MKKRSIKSYADLPPQLIKKIDMEYPYGFDEELFEVKGDEKSGSYKAMWFETDDVIYLIKFDKYLNTRSKSMEMAKDEDEEEDIDIEMEDEDESEDIKMEDYEEEMDEE